jgi:hypothetical protein
MLIFIDDSGDPGFKLTQGSSAYFVISLLIFDDPLEAEKTAVAIKTLRRKLGFPDSQEFKFNKSRPNVRLQFLEAILPFSFRVRSLVVNKEQIYSPELQTKRESFYAYFIKMALKYSNNTIVDAKIRIDGGGDRAFRKQFLTYLRKELNVDERKVVKHCQLVDSKNNVLIQAADMVAGSVRRAHEKSDKIYIQTIKGKIENEWLFK